MNLRAERPTSRSRYLLLGLRPHSPYISNPFTQSKEAVMQA